MVHASLSHSESLAVRRALREFKDHGITRRLPPPFERRLLDDVAVWDAAEERLRGVFRLGGRAVRDPLPLCRVTIPKREPFAVHRLIFPQPLETAAYSAIVFRLAEAIEQVREATAGERVFSHRWRPSDGGLFDPGATPSTFKAETLRRVGAPSIRVLVQADVLGLGEHISLTRLNEELAALPEADGYSDALLARLRGWSSNGGRGLPYGMAATWLLDELVLNAVDRRLVEASVAFTRFVDDYRLFAGDIAGAWVALDVLRDALSEEGLELNLLKTRLEDVSDPQPHEVAPSLRPTRTRILPNSLSALPHHRRGRSKGGSVLPHLITDAEEAIGGALTNPTRTRLRDALGVVERFPPLAPLTVKALSALGPALSPRVAAAVGDEAAALLHRSPLLPSYARTAVARLLGRVPFQRPDALVQALLNAGGPSYCRRVMVEGLASGLRSEDARMLRAACMAGDLWERRALGPLIEESLTGGERSSWRDLLRFDAKDAGELFYQVCAEAPAAAREALRKEKAALDSQAGSR